MTKKLWILLIFCALIISGCQFKKTGGATNIEATDVYKKTQASCIVEYETGADRFIHCHYGVYVDSTRITDSGEIATNKRSLGKVEVYKGGSFRNDADATSYNYNGEYIGKYNEALKEGGIVDREIIVELDKNSNPIYCTIKGREIAEKSVPIEDCEPLVNDLGI